MNSDSFVAQVRDEVARHRLKPCCQEPFLMGMLSGAKFFRRYGKAVLRLTHGATVRAVVSMLKKRGISHSWRQEVSKEGKLQFYLIELPELPPSFFRLPAFKDICCRRSWMAGLFLVSGTVADPRRDYFLEWCPASWDCAHLLVSCLIDENVEPVISTRGKGLLVCMKRGEDVAAALSLIGATLARLELEEVRAIKETNNDLHRLVNAETANIKRTADAAVRQIEKIKVLQDRNLIGSLPGNLAEVAILRVENPDLSYRELGEMMHPPLTRASVGKKLAKIEQIAEEFYSS